jgi:hypothetical protein
LYFRDPDGIRFASTIVSTNKVFRIKRPKKVDKNMWEKYGESLLVHEVTHARSCLNTEFKRAIVISSLFSPIGFLREKDFFVIYNCEIVPILEALAIYNQVTNVATTAEFRQIILDHLKVHDPACSQLMEDFHNILGKFEGKFQRRRKFDIFNIIMDLILSSPNPLKDRIYDRLRLIRDIPEGDIPAWKDTLDMQFFIAKCFRKDNRGIVSQNLFMRESYESLLYFWNGLKQLLREHSSDYAIEERVKEHIFAILSELDIAFAPIIYEVDDLEELRNREIIRCLMSESMSRNGFFDTIRLNTGVLNRLISEAKSSERDYKRLLENLGRQLSKLDNLKKEAFSKCPGIEVCRAKSQCELEGNLWKAVKKVFIDKTG